MDVEKCEKTGGMIEVPRKVKSIKDIIAKAEAAQLLSTAKWIAISLPGHR